ncbi:MAG: Type 1 glutamine amidotransferase-like domain-containing protein [Candidatus Dojkabacteria bacterium]|nr:Type 1 glutamine amidotransferase-like domain-containing protein [Candidatus Dojkabacteria bacterium]
MSKVLLVSHFSQKAVRLYKTTLLTKTNQIGMFMPARGISEKSEVSYNVWKELVKSNGDELIQLDNSTIINEEEKTIFEKAAYLIVPGGNTYILLDNIKRNGYFNEIQSFLNTDNKTYLGMSAGAIITTDISISRDENEPNLERLSCPRLFESHYNSTL